MSGQFEVRGVQEARVRSSRDALRAARAPRRTHSGRRSTPLLLRRAGDRRKGEVRRLPRPLLVSAAGTIPRMKTSNPQADRRRRRFRRCRRSGSEQEGQLDADGKLTVNVPTAVPDRKSDYLYRIEARVTDDANREINGTGWIDRDLRQLPRERRRRSAISTSPEPKRRSRFRRAITTTSR